MQIKINELDKYCDDLRHPTEVQAILKADIEKGFSLKLSCGKQLHQVTNKQGEIFYFRTVDAALDVLIDVSNLSKNIVVDSSVWG